MYRLEIIREIGLHILTWESYCAEHLVGVQLHLLSE